MKISQVLLFVAVMLLHPVISAECSVLAGRSGIITWSYEDWYGSHGGITKKMAMPDDGSMIYVAWNSNYERISAYETEGTGTPLWEYDVKEGSTYYVDDMVLVRVSDDGNLLVASVRDRKIPGDWDYTSLLYRLDPETGNEIWSPIAMPPTGQEPNNTQDITNLEIAADGSKIIVATKGYRFNPVYEPFYIYIYNPSVSLLHIFELPDPARDIVGINDIKVNDDGSRMIADFYMYDTPAHIVKVWDLNTYTEIQEFDYGDSGPQCKMGLSGNGDILGIGDMRGLLGVFSFNSGLQQYEELWSYSIPPDYWYPWINAIEISKDGSILGMTSYEPNETEYHGYLYVFDVTVGSSYIYKSLDFGDSVQDVAISDDGTIVVGAGYGPEINPVNGWDLIAYSTYTDEDVYQMSGTYPGSLYSCEISSNGTRLATGGKRVHARSMGSGGWVYSIELDFTEPPTPTQTPLPNIPTTTPTGLLLLTLILSLLISMSTHPHPNSQEST
ncbi:WD40 repeat domain-containing protein [bacterium]|nr:WD40 repeat domain-containing protein [bacterium]